MLFVSSHWKLLATLVPIAATVTIALCTRQSDSKLSCTDGQRRSTSQPPPDATAVHPDSPQELLAATCRERADALQRRIGEPCATASYPPFVLAGNSGVSALDSAYVTLIQPTCELLNRRYFRFVPDEPIAILMFSDEVAYRRIAERLFFDCQVSRFGYHKPGRRAVLANLAEGDGTLRHELVHALMDFDFPDAPAWLQEGMATLYEATQLSHHGTLEPVANWRLAVVCRHLDAGHHPNLSRLVALPCLQGPMEAVNYALARYFCLFLHRRSLLGRVYRTMRRSTGTDPTGQKVLMTVLSCANWQQMDATFRDWVLRIGGSTPVRPCAIPSR
jgi:hypothetical protein